MVLTLDQLLIFCELSTRHSPTPCSVLCPSVVSDSPGLWDPMDCSPAGPPVQGDSPGKNYWSGLSCPPPGDLPNPGTEPRSPTMQADSLPSEPPRKPYIKWDIWAGWPQRCWSVPKILCWKNIHKMTWELANSSGQPVYHKIQKIMETGQ